MIALALPLVVLMSASAGAAERCPSPAELRRGIPQPARCAPPARKIEPHDPDRLRAGTRPGFIDLGGGTEVRIGGRARVDYDRQR